MLKNTSLKNQVALITGASQGIGTAVTKHLAAEGMHLALAARSLDKLEALKTKLTQQYPQLKIITMGCDVSDAAQVQAMADAALQQFGRIDVLVNNAGVAPKVTLLQEMSIEDINRTIDTNLKGAIYVMRAVLPAMVQQQAGVIININSVAGKTAYPYWAVYDASKFGLHAITDAVAEEQSSNNIKVIGIYPGAVNTPIWEGLELDHQPNLEGMLDAEQVADAVVYALQQPQKAHIKEIVLAPLKPAL